MNTKSKVGNVIIGISKLASLQMGRSAQFDSASALAHLLSSYHLLMPLRREGCWRSLVRCVNISMYICWRKEIAKMKLLNRRISFVPRNCKRTKSWLWGLNPHLAFSFGWKHINQKSLFAPIDWTWAHKSALATSFPRDLNMWAKFDSLTYKSGKQPHAQ